MKRIKPRSSNFHLTSYMCLVHCLLVAPPYWAVIPPYFATEKTFLHHFWRSLGKLKKEILFKKKKKEKKEGGSNK